MQTTSPTMGEFAFYESRLHVNERSLVTAPHTNVTNRPS